MTLSGILLLILLFLCLKDNNIEKAFIPSRIKNFWYLFLIYSILQTFFTLNPVFHLGGIIGHYLIYWLIFWMLGQSLSTEQDLEYCLKSILISGTILSVIAAFVYFGWKPDIKLLYIPLFQGEFLLNFQATNDYGHRVRASGFMMNPNILGSYLLISLISSLGLLINDKKNYNFFSIFIQTIALALSKSRGAILSLFTGFILLFGLIKKYRLLILSLFSLGAVFLLYISEDFIKIVLSVSDPSYHSNQLRFQVWETAIDIIKQHPFGIGILSYENLYKENYYQPGTSYISHVHNWYLHTAVESGIIGSILFFSFYLYLLYYFYQNLREDKKFILIALISFSIFNLTDYVLTDTRICFLLTILIFAGIKYSEKEKITK